MSRIQRDIILAQIYQALGQGTGPVRVSRAAVTALGQRYRALITDAVVDQWGAQGPQVLERIRTIGRMAAQRTIAQGKTAIGAEECVQAAVAIEKVSATSFCPPNPEAWQGGDIIGQPGAAALAQCHVAFGQGCGVTDLQPEAVRALNDRYRGMLSEDLLGCWGEVAAQLLERIRAVGRLVRQRADLAGEAAISPEEVLAASLRVEQVSACPYCPFSRLAAPVSAAH